MDLEITLATLVASAASLVSGAVAQASRRAALGAAKFVRGAFGVVVVAGPSRGLVVPGVEVGEDAVGGLLAGLAGLLEEAHAGDGVGTGEVEAFRALESFYGRVEFRRLGPLLDDAGEDDVRGEGMLRGGVGVPRLEDVAVEGSLGVVAVEPGRELKG